MNPQPVMSVQSLKKYFPVTKGAFLKKVVGHVMAVENVSFDIFKGETLGIVGESGCGKSTTANVLLGLESPTDGKILFNGEDITGFKGKTLFRFRRNIQAVLQDPFRSLNPRKKVRHIIGEPLYVHKTGTHKQISKRVDELLELVGLKARHADLYPHEFSGGQRQRIAVARSLSLEPKAIILDEPVSALDVSIQAQIINLLIDLQQKLNLTYLIISHDLAVVEHASSHIGVMYLGHLVELSVADELYQNPLHPYTRALLESVPVPDPENIKPVTLEGEVPNPMFPPEGCPFHPRCEDREEVCRTRMPDQVEHSEGHFVKCHLYGEKHGILE
jgi:oligopeptide/dipeptide ABC transporter ATP-binding protein